MLVDSEPPRVSRLKNSVRTILEIIQPGLGMAAFGSKYREVRGKEEQEPEIHPKDQLPDPADSVGIKKSS